jgi:membrane associated rhomboid family serine protease
MVSYHLQISHFISNGFFFFFFLKNNNNKIGGLRERVVKMGLNIALLLFVFQQERGIREESGGW